MIDYLFGGPGRGDAPPSRELTEIELTLVRDLLDPSLGDLGYAFAALGSPAADRRGVQYNPQFVQAAGRPPTWCSSPRSPCASASATAPPP